MHSDKELKGGRTGVEFEADEQHLRHDEADGLERLARKHEGQAQPAHVELACARPQQHQNHCQKQDSVEQPC